MKTVPHGSAQWRKSSYSNTSSSCVEVAVGSTTGVRDTKNRAGGQLAVDAAGWSTFLCALKADRLDA